MRSRDDSCFLQTDIDAQSQTKEHVECMTIDFLKVDSSTQGYLLYLDGGPRNFQYIQGIMVHCVPAVRENAEETFLTSSSDGRKGIPIFQVPGKARKDYQGIVCCCIFKDGWDEDGTSKWMVKSCMEAIHVAAVKEKEDFCDLMIVNTVPALEKFKPRLFANVRAICAALSSHSLPKLKKKFTVNGALSIGQFTSVIFKQLYSTHPHVIDEAEAGCTVAMLQEMFHQIDFNGDTTVDWDEFTTFCIQTGLSVSSTAEVPTDSTQSDTLDEYIIEYGEELLMRDRVLSPHRYITLCRHIPDTRKLLVIPEDSDNIFIFDEKFKLKSRLYPNKVQVIGATGAKVNESSSSSSASDSMMAVASNSAVHGRIMIYDAIYLTSRELYAFCASDHTITICKEQQIGARINYIQHNRFFHSLLHLKLCWSAKSKVLCSVASDKVIYGWDIDAEKPIFQISRHSDLITDMISIDHFELFATCSMDKRIVLWSSTTRRVKGVLLGHKRGVRCLDVFENSLLSAGFETEAKTWDLVSKECTAVLKGHRRPVAAAKLMCQRAQSEEEHRAITVDEGGEFRLWNVYVKERSAEPALVPTLQIFEMTQAENPINCMRFLAIPNDPILSTSYYSNLIACSTKLLSFLPEKNAKEFLPPTACIYNEAAASLATAVGKSIMKYDICTGQFSTAFSDLYTHDLTALCLDGERGRRIFVGCSNGEILLVNFMTGQIISQTHAHSREVTCISVHLGMRHNIYSGSLDGRLRMLEEDSGNIHVHNTVENAFGEGIGIQFVQVVDLLSTVVAVSNSNKWGVWNSRTFKRMALFEEANVITACQIIGTTLDTAPVKEETDGAVTPAPGADGVAKKKINSKFLKKEKLLTLAFAFSNGVFVYTLDIVGIVGVASYHLKPEIPVEITCLETIKFSDGASMNYPQTRGKSALSSGSLLVGTCDDGHVITWEMNTIRKTSEALFHKKFMGVIRKKEKPIFSNEGAPEEEEANLSGVPTPRSITPLPNSEADYTGCLPAVDENFEGEGSKGVSAAMLNKKGKGGKQRSVLDMKLLEQIENHDDCSENSFSVNVGMDKMKSDLSEALHEAEIAEKLNRLFNSDDHGVGVNTIGGVSNNVPFGEDKKQQAAAKKAAEAAFDHNNSSYLVSADVFGVPAKEARKRNYNLWRAHRDVISTFVSMADHGCIITVSLDGYHRIWNMDSVCLGEMPLPNITEAMKNPTIRVVKKTGWKFILERIPVSPFHKQIATQLVNDIIGSQKPSRSGSSVPRRGAQSLISNFGSGKFSIPGVVSSPTPNSKVYFEQSLDVDTEQALARSNVLKSLSEPPVLPDDAPPTSLAQRRLDMHHSGRTGTGSSELLETIQSGPTTGRNSRSTDQYDSFVSLKTSKSSKSRPSSSDIRLVGSISEDSAQPHLLSGLENSTISLDGNSRKESRFGKSSKSMRSLAGSKSEQTLWQLPGELKSASDFSVAPAFSEHSLFMAHQHGAIDGEGYRLLRQVASHQDKVIVYDRASSVLMLRNPALSISCEMPALADVRASEVNFGAQKGMYKNADKLLAERESMSKNQMRHIISLARIEQNVRKVNSMVHVLPPPAHDDVVLPKNASTSTIEDDNNKDNDMRTKYRLEMSASMVSDEARARQRPLDKAFIQKLMDKVGDATDNGPDWEAKLRESVMKKEALKRKKTKEKISVQAREGIERRLQNAIKSKLRSMGSGGVTSPPSTAPGAPNSPDKKKFVLTNRMLLPSYKMADVRGFLDVFNRTDEDFTGDLNINEWCKLFSVFSKSIPQHEIKLMFLQVDTKKEGVLTFRDIVPIVFSKADKNQIKWIIQFLEGEIVQKSDKNVHSISAAEIEQLFDCYDTDNIGFVAVSYIRERIRNMNLPEPIQFAFMESIVDLEEDEMVNNQEFLRIFRIYCSASSMQATNK